MSDEYTMPSVDGLKDPADWAKAGNKAVFDELRRVIHPERASENGVVNATLSGNERDNATVDDADDACALFTPNAITGDFLCRKRKGRPWLYRKMYIRGKLTAIGGAGGVGKSMFTLVTFMSMALGRDLLKAGYPTIPKRRVLLLNNEDEQEELELRIEAVMRKHSIQPEDFGDRFHFASGYHKQIRLAMRARDAGGSECFVATDVFVQVERFVRDNGIDIVGCDPLVSLHDAKENDNGEMDQVMSVLKAMAARTKVGFVILHHTNKGTESASIDNSMRGASAVVNAARCVVVFTRMTERERERTTIEPKDRTRYLCAHHGKSNMSLPAAEGEWYCLNTVDIDVIGEDGNDDIERVGVPIPVDMGELLTQGEEAENPQAKWTPTRAAELIEPKMKGISSVLASDIRGSVAVTAGVSDRWAFNILNLIPIGKENAITILVHGDRVRYWREKESHKTAPSIIFREEF